MKKSAAAVFWLLQQRFLALALFFYFTVHLTGSGSIFPARFHYSSSQISLPHFGQRYSTMSLYTVRKRNVFICLSLLPVGTFPEWLHPLLCPITSSPPTTSSISFIYVISVFILPLLFFFIFPTASFLSLFIRRFIQPPYRHTKQDRRLAAPDRKKPKK